MKENAAGIMAPVASRCRTGFSFMPVGPGKEVSTSQGDATITGFSKRLLKGGP
jgi:hypothetical protein